MTPLSPALIAALTALPGVELLSAEPMARHTTYRVGGPAAGLVTVATADALDATLDLASAHRVDVVPVGNGSNVLVADAGVSGIVLKLGGDLATGELQRDARGPGAHTLQAGGGLSITRLLRVAKDARVGGVEFLGGVPGTVGGAVRMNAGTVLGEVSSSLIEASIAQPGVPIAWVAAADLGLAYRHSELPAGAIVTAARFACSDGGDEARARLDEVLAYRKATQPLRSPSCGSVFANPPGDHAGRLIEVSGLKGRTIGGAQVSEQHANWIINTGTATAADVHALIELCRTEVERQHDVLLRPEVRLLGEWGS